MNNLKYALNYGLIGGLCLFGMFLLIYLLGMNPLGNAGWLAIWVPFVFIYLSMKNTRDKLLNGEMSYGKAFIVGMATVVAYAIAGNMLNFLFISTISPQIFTEFIDQTILDLEKVEGILGPDMYDKAIESLDKSTALSNTFSTIMNQTIGGLIICLIFAIFMKKNEAMFENKETI